MTAPINNCVRKNLEQSFIAPSRPSLNEQIDLKKLFLSEKCYMTILFFQVVIVYNSLINHFYPFNIFDAV